MTDHQDLLEGAIPLSLLEHSLDIGIHAVLCTRDRLTGLQPIYYSTERGTRECKRAKEKNSMFEALVAVCIIGYIAFRNWLNHDKRRMVHRERIAAIEKGIQLPAIEQEVERRTWNVQRFLLLAGWPARRLLKEDGHCIRRFARDR